MQEKSIQRICKFASCKPCPSPLAIFSSSFLGSFETYAKRIHDYVKETMELLRAHSDSSTGEANPLRRPYDANVGVFPCRSFNLGEQSISFPHTDDGNLAHSWCSITPLSQFNPKTGGHLVLWDFGLIIEFPPGTTILIPSAFLRHSNTSIHEGESQYSVIQYAAGDLFRWVYHRFKTEDDWKVTASPEDLKAHTVDQENRWKEAVVMFTTMRELVSTEASLGKK